MNEDLTAASLNLFLIIIEYLLLLIVKFYHLVTFISGSSHFIAIQICNSTHVWPIELEFQTFSVKDQKVNILVLQSYMVSVEAVQHCLCSAEAAIENILTYGNSYVQIEFYVNKQTNKQKTCGTMC